MILTFLVSLFSTQKLVAQNTSPYWSLAGNSNASSTTSKLGTTNAINLRLFTNNIERVHINYSNGYVGIGTTAPAYKLHVANTVTSIYGYSTGGYGIYGNTTSVAYAGVYGVGPATTGIGVRGLGGNYGAFDSSNNGGIGVYGGSKYVAGKLNTGVFGRGYYGVQGIGSTYGVYGEGNIGVYGYTSYYIGDAVRGYTTGAGYGGYFVSDQGIGVYGLSRAPNNFGVYGEGKYGTYGRGDTIGVYGYSVNSLGVGVYGNSYYGVYGVGSEAVFAHSNVNNGDAVYGYADGGGSDWGGNFYSSTSYGIVASTGVTGGIAGWFNGSIYTTGTYQGSDRKLKQNITDVTNALDIINKLQPKYYEYRQDGNFKEMNLPTGKHYGLIAQDVEQILPGLVKETEFISKPIKPKGALGPVKINPDRSIQVEKINPSSNISQENKTEVNNFKALNYTELIPIIVKAMQEQQQQIGQLKDENNDLRKDVSELKKEMADLKALVTKNNLIGNGYDLNKASLEQNTPNPYNSATIIRYHLPRNAGSAKVVITDMSGKTIKSISLISGDNGQLTLNSGTLAAGSYNYTLWIDGKQVDSKKMVISK
jgi:hypothetical protein